MSRPTPFDAWEAAFGNMGPDEVVRLAYREGKRVRDLVAERLAGADEALVDAVAELVFDPFHYLGDPEETETQ